MSTTYKIKHGDTFELISKKFFGSEVHGKHIANANPGITTTLIPGTNIAIPPLPDYPGDLPRIFGIEGENDVQIYIDGNRFEFWTSLTVKRSIDSIDSVTFDAPFDPAAPGYQGVFEPFSYKSLRVSIGDKTLITGTLVTNDPGGDEDKDIITCSGYSLPGVLQDCNAPSSMFPLEFNNINLLDIAKAISKPFGLSVIASDNVGKNFDLVALKPDEKPFEFLTKLAKQRNLIISSTEDGKIRFWKSRKKGNVVANLEMRKPPLLTIKPNFNEQEYYSSITGISFVATGIPGSQYTDKNPYLPGTIRPFTFGASDVDNVDIQTATYAKTGRMFANMVSYTLEVSTWRDKGGNLWQPNTLIEVLAPSRMIYYKYNFILRSVEFKREGNNETATLILVLPGGFDGSIPETLPWNQELNIARRVP